MYNCFTTSKHSIYIKYWLCFQNRRTPNFFVSNIIHSFSMKVLVAIFKNSKGYDEVYDFIFFFNPKQVCFFIRQNGGSMFDKKAV